MVYRANAKNVMWLKPSWIRVSDLSMFREVFERKGIIIEDMEIPAGLVRMIRNQGAINTYVAPLIEKAFVDGNINFGLTVPSCDGIPIIPL